MGSKSPSEKTTTNTPNPVAMGAYTNVLGKAQQAADTPYQAFGGELVAGINGQQTSAINNINSASGIANPYISSASNYAGLGAAAINPMQFSADAVGQYMSPYQQSVINSTLATINNQNAQQQQGVIGDAIKQGAWGGDRAGIAQAELAGQQDLAKNQTIAQLNNQNYAQALGQFNNQQATGLGAAQNNAARAGQAAYTMGSLGQEAQNTALTGAGAQLQAGGLQQGTQQAQDTAGYQQFLNAQAYPFQTAGWLANIASGVGSQMGGTSTTTQTPPSSLNSIIGGGLSLASMFLNRGGVVSPERYAAGGGIGGSPYEGGLGYVPQINLNVGHTMPTGGDGAQQPAGQPSGQSMLDKGLSSLGSSVKGAGGLGALAERFGLTGLAGTDGNASAFTGMPDLPMGDDIPMPMGRPDGLARGGLVRAGYFDGGDVSPSDLTFDPDAMKIAPTDLVARPGDTAKVEPVVATKPDPTFSRMIGLESGGHQFGPDGQPLTSPKGATGIAQVMPGTAPEAAKLAGLPFDENRYRTDPEYNQALGRAYYDKQLQDFGSSDRAAAAYNAGPGAMRGAIAKAQANGGSYLDYLPSETRNYVASVIGGPSALAMRTASPTVAGGPLAYDDTARGGVAPAQSAISTATSGLGNAAPAAQDETGLFGLPKLSDNARMGLLAAGLGMMSSRSPWVGVAAGEGGQAGLNAYFGASKNQRENANVSSEIANRAGELAIRGRAQDLAEKQAQRLIDASAAAAKAITGSDSGYGSGSPAGGPNVPQITAPGSPNMTRAPAGGAGATATAPGGNAPAPQGNNGFDWGRVSPQSNPAFLDDRASRLEQAAVAASASPEVSRQYLVSAQQYRQNANAIRQSGIVTLRDGSTALMPGFAESKAGIAGAEADAKAGAESRYKFRDVQPTPGGPTYSVRESNLPGGVGQGQGGVGAGSPPGGVISKQPESFAKASEKIAEDEANMQDQFQGRQVARERLQQIKDLMQTYRTGAYSDTKAELVAKARALGLPIQDSDTANPAAFEQFMKNATASVFDQAKNLGGRILVTEINGLTKANANPGMQPAANAAIIGQGLGLLDYEDKYYKSYLDWKSDPKNQYATRNDVMRFNKDWVEQNPVRQYTDAAKKEISYSGQSIPPADQRKTGQVYMTPKGNARWMGTGWQLEH